MSVLLPLYGKTSDMELTSTKTGVPKEKGSGACAPAPPDAPRVLVCHGRIIIS